MHRFFHDLRFGFRALLRRPVLLLTATLTLGLGLGASVAVFSVIEAALLQPLPFEDADRLAVVWGVAGPDRDIRGASPIEIRDWDEGVDALGPLVHYNATTLNLTGGDGAEQLEGETVAPGYLDVLGVQPALGRGLQPADDEPGAAGSALISWDLWQRRFGGEPEALGRSIVLDDVAFTVVGVLPEGFRGMDFDTDVWVPFGPYVQPDFYTQRGGRWLAAVGRLEPGSSREAAQAELDAVAGRLAEAYPDVNADRGAMLVSMRDFYVDGSRPLLLMVLGGVAVLLLIASANVANLQLVRGIERRRELAVRSALGAQAGSIARQLVAESVALAALGGLLGLTLAWAGLQVLLPLVPPGVLPPYAAPGIDAPVLAFGLLATAAAAILFALAPSISALRQPPAASLRGAGRGATLGGPRLRAQRAIIVAEVALALTLLVGAGFAVRSLRAQLAIEPGFDPDGVLAARVSLTGERYPAPTRIALAGELVEALQATAGVEGAAVVSRAPLRGYNAASYIFRAEDPVDPEHRIRFYYHGLTPGGFDVLGIPLVAGRGFTAVDREDAPAVAVVSEAFAAKVWPGEEPLGRRVVFASDTATVVGVAANVRQRSLTTSLMDPGEDPDVYFPYAQLPAGSFDILVRAADDPGRFTGAIRRVVEARAPAVPIYDVATLESVLAGQTALGRMVSAFLGLFAALALAAAAVGLFGVLAFVVRGRRAEIALRAALGADAGRILRMVMGQGVGLVAAGLAVGAVGALAVGRLAASQLFGVQADDPVILVGTGAALLAVGAVASLVPAVHALRIDPRTAMAEE